MHDLFSRFAIPVLGYRRQVACCLCCMDGLADTNRSRVILNYIYDGCDVKVPVDTSCATRRRAANHLISAARWPSCTPRAVNGEMLGSLVHLPAPQRAVQPGCEGFLDARVTACSSVAHDSWRALSFRYPGGSGTETTARREAMHTGRNLRKMSNEGRRGNLHKHNPRVSLKDRRVI